MQERCHRPQSVRRNSLRTFWGEETGKEESGITTRKRSVRKLNIATSSNVFDEEIACEEGLKSESVLRRESTVEAVVRPTRPFIDIPSLNLNEDENDESEGSEGDYNVDEAGGSYSRLFTLSPGKIRTSKTTPHRLPRSISSSQCQYIFPILLGCSIRHGNIAAVSLQCLLDCLEAGVFDADINNAASECGTLLDLTVTTVCALGEHGIQNRFPLVITYLTQVVKKSNSGLRPKTLHRIVETYLFIQGCQSGYGITPLKEFLKILLDRVEATSLQKETFFFAEKRKKSNESSLLSMLHDVVYEVVDSVVERVELAKSTELVVSCCKVRNIL